MTCAPLVRSIGLPAIGVTVAAFASSLPAQIVDAPHWKVGDKWVFEAVARFKEDPGVWSREVVAIGADGHATVRFKSGATFEFDEVGNRIDKRGAEFNGKRFDFPLAVGKTWSNEHRISGGMREGSETTSWRVVSYEKLTVPAGTFACMKVEGVAYRHWAGGNSHFKGAWETGITRTQYWYCPDVQWMGKLVIEEQSSPGMPWAKEESVLTSFEHAK